MRKRLLLLAPLLAAPLAAQDFEGTITMRMENDGIGAADVTVHMKGDIAAYTITLPSGPTAGQKMRMIMNGQTRMLTILMPAMPGMPLPAGSKGAKIVSEMADAQAAASERTSREVKLTKLGTSQTLAGIECDDYVVEQDDKRYNMCVTESLGGFRMPTSSGIGPSAPSPAWARAFGDKPMFPLKVWSDGNEVAMEVTSVKRGAVPAGALDDSGDGYIDLSAMMRGMGRRN